MEYNLEISYSLKKESSISILEDKIRSLESKYNFQYISNWSEEELSYKRAIETYGAHAREVGDREKEELLSFKTEEVVIVEGLGSLT